MTRAIDTTLPLARLWRRVSAILHARGYEPPVAGEMRRAVAAFREPTPERCAVAVQEMRDEKRNSRLPA